jgi:hypothetical protein
MTTLERPLPLQVVLVALVLCCIGGFAMGLMNAMKLDRGGPVTTQAPLAESSGAPIKDAAPALAYEPPPVEAPKPKAVEVKTVEQEAPPPAPVVEAPPPAPTAAVTENKPVEPQAPRSIEDLY